MYIKGSVGLLIYEHFLGFLVGFLHVAGLFVQAQPSFFDFFCLHDYLIDHQGPDLVIVHEVLAE